MDFLSAIKIVPNPSGLITVNETLFVQLFSFLLFVFIINRIMFRPLRETMTKRDRYLDEIKSDIDNADAELQSVSKLIRQSEMTIKDEAHEMQNTLEVQGKQEALQQIEAGRKEISILKENADQEIKQEIETARSEIQSEFEALSIIIMEKILDRRLTS